MQGLSFIIALPFARLLDASLFFCKLQPLLPFLLFRVNWYPY